MTRGRGCRASGLRRDQGRHAHGPCSVPTLLSSRSKDRTELESSDGHAEKTHPEYSEELEELCEQLRATLDGLVRARDPAPACSPSPSPGLAAPRAAVPAPDPGFPSVALLPHLAPQCGPRPSSFWSCVWSAAVPPPSRPHSKYFRALWAPRSVLRPLSSSRRDSTWASGCRCVPATLRMWTLRSEFHTSFVCHRIFFFFQAFKSVKPILSSRAIWK